ncbi:MAG TPA: hypothetical protein VJ851_13850 [Jatrophihabitans sp.]|nr:hypothetical protein [Jatrophihabitans sp.]
MPEATSSAASAGVIGARRSVDRTSCRIHRLGPLSTLITLATIPSAAGYSKVDQLLPSR